MGVDAGSRSESVSFRFGYMYTEKVCELLETMNAKLDQLLRNQISVKAPTVAVTDPWLTVTEACEYLGDISRTTFFQLRRAHPVALAPASADLLRFSRNALDVFKATGGVALTRRRGLIRQRGHKKGPPFRARSWLRRT